MNEHSRNSCGSIVLLSVLSKSPEEIKHSVLKSILENILGTNFSKKKAMLRQRRPDKDVVEEHEVYIGMFKHTYLANISNNQSEMEIFYEVSISMFKHT